MEFRRAVQTGQNRGRWSGVPLESRHALRRDNLVAAGVQLLNGRLGATRKQFIDYCVNMLLSTAATYAPHRERGESEHSIPAGPHN